MIIKDGKHITTERRKIVYSANLKENCYFKSCFFVSAFLFFFIPYLILTTPPHTLDPLNNKSILGSYNILMAYSSVCIILILLLYYNWIIGFCYLKIRHNVICLLSLHVTSNLKKLDSVITIIIVIIW
jgi:hypothetical protein